MRHISHTLAHPLARTLAVNQEDFDLRKDYLRWRQSNRFSFCGRYSFIYAPPAKATLLHMDTHNQQMMEFQGALAHAIMAGGGMPFLYLRVRAGWRGGPFYPIFLDIKKALHENVAPRSESVLQQARIHRVSEI